MEAKRARIAQEQEKQRQRDRASSLAEIIRADEVEARRLSKS